MTTTVQKYELSAGDKIIVLSKEHPTLQYKEIATLKEDDGSKNPFFINERGGKHAFTLTDYQWSKINIINQANETIELGGKKYIKSELEEALKHIKPVE